MIRQPFDPKRLELNGRAEVIAEGLVANRFLQIGAFSVSKAGILAFWTGNAQGPSQLIWVDRDGKQEQVLGEEAYYRHPQLSPDGRRAAVAIRDVSEVGTNDLWLFDLQRKIRSRFTYAAAEERFPVWSPDGKRICFTAGRDGSLFNIYEKASNSGGAEQLLWQDNLTKYPTSWSPDGRFILYETGASTPNSGVDLWILPLLEIESRFLICERPLLKAWGDSLPTGSGSRITPMNRAGMRCMSAFPATGEKWQVSTGGGSDARWKGDGSKMYLSGGKLMAAAVKTAGASVQIGAIRELFDVRPVGPGRLDRFRHRSAISCQHPSGVEKCNAYHCCDQLEGRLKRTA